MKFTKNLDLLGRILRLVISAILFGLSYKFSSWILLLAGLFTLAEALFSWCLLFAIFGINHCRLKK
jgi:Protein of unknown function (DUF2892)